MPESLPPAECIAHIMALTAQGGADAAYKAIDALAQDLFGHRLFTVTKSLLATQEVERAYSSNTAAYPVGGRKQKQGTPWGAQVLDRGEPLICHGADDIRRTFTDHETILGLGITGMINVPVRFAGRSVATMNVSHAEDRFTAADLPALLVLAGLILPLVLAE